MKKYFLLILLFASVMVHAQTVPNYIYGKDVIISMRDTSSAELTIKNSTRTVTGFLKNIGAGKTTFKVLDIADVTGLQTALNGKLPATITTPSTGQLIRYNGTTWVNWNPTFLGIPDTAAMLSNRLKISDTATMLNGYARSGNVVKYTDVGANNGVAGLDAGGKVPFSQLPASLYIYKGTWDASTNTPTLANGSGTSGWVYQASVAGTVNFGAGAITFAAGDYVGYNGSIWQWSPGTNAVRSVNGQQGVVSLTTANIPEGGTDYYWTAARSRAAQSVTVTGLSYDNSTGVISLTSGYVIPTTTQQSNWNTAYGWGNHATAGYLSATTAATTYLPLTGGVLSGNLGFSTNLTGINFRLPSSPSTTVSAVRFLDGGNGWESDIILYTNASTGDPTLTERMRIPRGGTGGAFSGITMSKLVVSGDVSASSFTGAGTGLTGTASGLSIGGTAGSETLATVTGRGASTGAVITAGAFRAGTTNTIGWTGQGGFESVSNGVYKLYNEARNAYGDITIGGLTAGAISVTTGGFSGNVDMQGTLIVRGNGSAYTTHYFTTGAANVAAYNQYNAAGTLVNRISAGSASYITGGNFGIGTTAPTHNVHVFDGLSGVSAPDSRTKIRVESSGEAYISFNSPDNQFTGVRFGSPANPVGAYIEYDAATANIGVGTVVGSDYKFITNAIERGRIKASGRWLIGTTSDNGTDALQVNGSVYASSGFSTTSTGTAYWIKGDARLMATDNLSLLDFHASTSGHYIGSNFYDGGSYYSITMSANSATYPSQFVLNTNGTIVAASSITATAFYETPSDIRKKTVVRRWKSADGIDQIEYYLKNDPDRKILYGYEAQQVMRVIPSAVITSKDATMPNGVSYSVGYTQVSIYKIAQLEQRITQLEKQLKR